MDKDENQSIDPSALKKELGDVKRLHENYHELVDRMDALEGKGKSAGEERANLDKADKELAAKEAAISEAVQTIKAVEERQKKLEEKLSRPGGTTSTVDSDEQAEYKATLCEYMRKDFKGLSEERQKALTSASNSGGAAINNELHNSIIERLTEISPVRPLAMQVRTDTSEYDFPLGSGQYSASYVGDTTQAPDSTGFSLVGRKVNVHDLTVKVDISRNTIMDTDTNLYDYFVKEISKRMMLRESEAFINGTGTNQPLGFLNRDSSGDKPVIEAGVRLPAATTALTYDHVVDLMYAVKDPTYRKMGTYACATGTIAELRKIKDGDSRPLFTVGHDLIGGTPFTLNGRPFVEMVQMPDRLGTDKTNKDLLIYGDWDEFAIVDRLDPFTIRDEITRADYRQIRFVVYARNGSSVLQTNAFSILTSRAATGAQSRPNPS